MKIELHMLQNFAPSCLNRDDTNTPKTCDFGGVRRARISSQCFKRAIRWEETFRSSLAGNLGMRSLDLPRLVRDDLVKGGIEEQVADAICGSLYLLGKKEESSVEGDSKGRKSKDADGGVATAPALKTSQLIFFAQSEVKDLAARIKAMGKKMKPKEIVEALKEDNTGLPKSVDIALFGRFVTSDYFTNVDAACQVAHAISTHRVNVEIDYYTAVDDLQPKDEAGAGFLGVNEFDSACFYRFSVIDLPLLVKNLSGDKALAKRGVEAFIRAAVAAIPSGRQNVMAAYQPPSLVMAVVRKQGQPVSLTNAFVKPAQAHGEHDLVEASIRQLEEHWASLAKVFGTAGVTVSPVVSTYPLDGALKSSAVVNLDALVAGVNKVLA